MRDRLLYFGRNHGFGITLRAFSRLVALLRGSSHSIVQVIVSDDHHGQPDTLESLAAAAGIPWCAAARNRVNAPEFVSRLAALNPTLTLTVQFPQLYEVPLRAVTPRGSLNVHRGWPLRGGSIDERAIVEGLSAYWVILHHVVDRIDAGPIVARRAIAISAQDTGWSLAEKADAAGEALVAEAVVPLLGLAVPAGTAQIVAQTRYANKGVIAPVCDLLRSADELDRLARAFDHPRKEGLALSIRRCLVRVNRLAVGLSSGLPGTILASGQSGVEIAAGTGSVIIREVRRHDRKVVPLAQIIAEQKLGVGDTLLTQAAAGAES